MKRVACGLSLLLVFSFAAVAYADEPAAVPVPLSAAEQQVERDRDEILVLPAVRFCRAPKRPLSAEAEALCPLAASAPDCAGYAALCAELNTPKAETPSWLASIGQALASVMKVLVWVFLAALLLVMLVPIARGLMGLARKRRRSDDSTRVGDATVDLVADNDAAAPAAQRPAADFLVRADRLLQAGQVREALSCYLAASLRGLADRGALVLARHRTNGEYVRSCTDETARAELRAVVNTVDRAEFGAHAPDADELARVQGLARRLAGIAAMTLLALGLVSCTDKATKGLAATDPAGHEVLVELLTRRGVKITPLRTSLTQLPMPTPADPDTEPAGRSFLLIDTGRTAVSEEAWNHLERWVKSGGNLIVAGLPSQLHAGFHIKREHTGDRTAQVLRPEAGEEEDNEAAAQTLGPELLPLSLARGAALSGGTEIARVGEDKMYAVYKGHGAGSLLAIASAEPLSNIGLAPKGNAAAALRLITYARPVEITLAGPLDGLSLPDSPMAALAHAGLLRGLWHALVFALLLFAYAGIRQARATPPKSNARRAFAEHVRATGALYKKARAGVHARKQYAPWVIEELHARRADRAVLDAAKRAESSPSAEASSDDASTAEAGIDELTKLLARVGPQGRR
jgi:hypothetical protein